MPWARVDKELSILRGLDEGQSSLHAIYWYKKPQNEQWKATSGQEKKASVPTEKERKAK